VVAIMNRRYERELGVAVRAVGEATRLCRAVRAEISSEVLAKRDKSPVTVADFGSQALICRALMEAFPDDSVIAEEDAAELLSIENRPILDRVTRHVRSVRETSTGERAELGNKQVCEWIDRGGSIEYQDRFWTVDPIDGTKGFLRGEQYAVALALIVGGEVAVAALACPNLRIRAKGRNGEGGNDAEESLGVIFAAVKGEGAVALPAKFPEGIEPSGPRLEVSAVTNPAGVRFCESVESGHSAHGDAADVAARLGITAAPVRMDSQAKYAVVARGEAEIYLRLPTRADYREKIWDHAAGALVVAEAGGVVTDIHGRPLEFQHGRDLVANRGVIVSNGPLHSRVIEAIEEIGIGQV
jgi:HAL2 family 3'(2'),5'-bisphosphate nucleotidase